MEICLLRHSESESSLIPTPFNGALDGPLTKKGLLQARNLCKSLQSEKIEIAFVSSLLRTKQTAEEIIKQTDSNIPIKADKRLNELSPGVFGGLSLEEIKDQYKDVFLLRQKDKFNYVIPGGESYKMVYDRVSSFIKELLTKNKYSKVLIVTHATTLKILLYLITKKDLKEIESVFYGHNEYFKFDLKLNKGVIEVKSSEIKHLEL